MKIIKEIIYILKIAAVVYGVIGLIHLESWLINVDRLGWSLPFSWLFS